MTDPETGASMIGMHLTHEGVGPYPENFLKQQWGRYYGSEISFCFECVIDAMFHTNPDNEKGN
jgi:hypothetical protein